MVYRLGSRHHDQLGGFDTHHQPFLGNRLDLAQFRQCHPKDSFPIFSPKAAAKVSIILRMRLCGFHAIDRYLQATGDRWTLRLLLPKLLEIIKCHLEGTLFGIGVDSKDGLLRQGQEGYQLTWMDAKVDDWVVTPRRGKAVEINALWYNGLRLLQRWLSEEDQADKALEVKAHADRAQASFNERFWYGDEGYLFDVIDGDDGNDAACRPNQLLAISLHHAVLDLANGVRCWKPFAGGF